MPRSTRSLGRRPLAAAFVVGLAACGGCGGSGASDSGGDGNTLKVALATPSWNAGFSTFLLSQARGYFKDEGIDVQFTFPPSGTQAAQQVIAGGADVALVTPEPVIIGATKGTDLTYFATYYGDWIYSLASVDGSGIDTVGDLKGKRVGVTDAASSGATFARTALKSAGVDPNDVTLVPIGVGAQQISAIKDGRVDALALWDTQYQLVKNAGIKINDIAAPDARNSYGGGFIASKSMLKSHTDLLTKFGRAFAKGVVLAQADPQAAIKAMWKEEPDTAPPAGGRSQALAQEVRVLNVRLNQGLGIPKGKQNWGTIDRKRVQNAIGFSHKAGLIDKRIDADAIIDTSLLKKINGFSHAKVLKQAGKQ